MVDVKVEINEYAAFPTMVYKFKANLGADTHNQMATYIKVKKICRQRMIYIKYLFSNHW